MALLLKFKFVFFCKFLMFKPLPIGQNKYFINVYKHPLKWGRGGVRGAVMKPLAVKGNNCVRDIKRQRLLLK